MPTGTPCDDCSSALIINFLKCYNSTVCYLSPLYRRIKPLIHVSCLRVGVASHANSQAPVRPTYRHLIERFLKWIQAKERNARSFVYHTRLPAPATCSGFKTSLLQILL